MLKWRWIVGIVITVAFAVGLRLWGIEWGLPNALHAFSYHTDETVILLHSTNRIGSGGLNVFAGQFLPHFYNYGSLQLYLINISVSIVSAYMPAAHASGDFSRQLFSDYLTGRILTAIMGAISVWALWALGRRLYGEAAGLLGAFLLAVTPLHAQHSHFMTVDVPATMWVVLALLWCAKAQTDERRLRALVIAGAFAGFAAATKYNCAIAAVPVVYSCCNTAHPNLALSAKTKTTQIIAATSALIVAYLAACPGTLLESSLFLHDFLFEARHVSSQQELWFMGTGVGWWYIISRNLVDGLGLPLLWAAIGGAIYAVRKRSFGDILILLFVLPYYIVVGAAVSRYARYEIPLLPFLALWAARLLTDRSLYTLKTQKWIVGTATVAVTLATTASAIALLMPMSQPDPRDRAAEWISTNIPAAQE